MTNYTHEEGDKMVSLYDSEIKQILPDVLAKKPEVKAVSYALSKMVKRILEYCERVSVYAAIDKQRDDVLDMLAIELDTQYYETSLDIESKRNLIKGTLAWYATSGTPDAVKELVNSVFGEGDVEEWFDYGDDPYWFKIVTDAQLTPELYDKLTTMIKKVKNVRSALRNVEIHRNVSLPERFNSGVSSWPHRTVINSPQRMRSVNCDTYEGHGVYSEAHVTVTNENI